MEPTTEQNKMIEIANLYLQFDGKELFNGLTINIHKGSLTIIAGGSGSGKSTLLNLLMGFLIPEKGTIRVNGVTLSENTLCKIRQQVAWVPQDLSFPLELVKEMIHNPLELKANHSAAVLNGGRAALQTRIFKLFDELDLEHDLYHKKIGEISGGQRQRILLVTAALLEKPLMICDEPTSALDADSTNRVISFFKRLQKGGTTVVCVSHSNQLIESSDQVIHLPSKTQDI